MKYRTLVGRVSGAHIRGYVAHLARVSNAVGVAVTIAQVAIWLNCTKPTAKKVLEGMVENNILRAVPTGNQWRFYPVEVSGSVILWFQDAYQTIERIKGDAKND